MISVKSNDNDIISHVWRVPVILTGLVGLLSLILGMYALYGKSEFHDISLKFSLDGAELSLN